MPMLKATASLKAILLLALVIPSAEAPASADEYQARKSKLSIRPFVNDPCAIETALDQVSFEAINRLTGSRILDNPDGWSVVARIGGRPFACFASISFDGIPWSFDERDFAPGNSGIPQRTLDYHFDAGKTVNRLLFTHKASNGYPTVVVFTPDGFLNVGAAYAPKLQGAVVRIGLIGEPFRTADYLQYIDNVSITALDDDTLRLLFDIHSQAGAGAVELDLHWNARLEQPELRFRAAYLARFKARLGFAGINFMRGPTLFGLLSKAGDSKTGIAAFHDGRSLFIEQPGRAVLRSLLIPPVTHDRDKVIQEDLVDRISEGSRLIMDQPQNAPERYFSKFPDPVYQDRTDLIVTLHTGTTAVGVRRAQTAVDLDAANPEANETVNVFYTASLTPDRVEEFTFSLEQAAQDFETQFAPQQPGVVFVSDQTWRHGSLFFLPLDHNFTPLGPAQPLTDGVITDPHRPSISSDGRYVIFDADDYRNGRRQRIYLLDLWRGTLRRLSIDPWGQSDDRSASLSADGRQFALITDRSGEALQLNIEDLGSGLGARFGNAVINAEDAQWSRQGAELAFIHDNTLQILDPIQGKLTASIALTEDLRHLRHPRLSPDGNRLAYAADSGVYLVNRDGSANRQVLADADHPSWADATRLIVQRTVVGETDLYLIGLETSTVTRLTAADGIRAAEPAFVPAPVKAP